MQKSIFILTVFVNIIIILPSCQNTLLTKEVETDQGKIVGKLKRFDEGDINYFLAIPYAEPPLGPLRFKRPIPVKKWDKVLKATNLPLPCYQLRLSLRYIRQDMSEDCLYINIAEKAEALTDKRKRPVLVVLDTKGLNFLTTSSPDEILEYNQLILRQDVIIVTLGYRTGIFGFAYSEKYRELDGNIGLWDQNMALRWVKDNIDSFGGDPDTITMVGEGSGATAVTMHMLSPMARDLFKNAIVSSGPNSKIGESVNERVTVSTDVVLRKMGCEEVQKDKLKCLQERDPKLLISAIPKRWEPFRPVFRNDYVPFTQEDVELGHVEINEVNLLIGTNKDDGSLNLASFAPQIFSNVKLVKDDAQKVIEKMFKEENGEKVIDIYLGKYKDGPLPLIQKGLIDMVTDLLYTCPSYNFAAIVASSQRKAATYVYSLNYSPKTSQFELCNHDMELGVCFRDELPLIYGYPYDAKKKWDYSNEDRRVSSKMMYIWAYFARYGLVF